MIKLTDKQETFCEHYAIHGHASDAYRYAYNAANSGDNTVAVEASRLLQVPNIALRLFELKTVAAEAFKITVEEKKQWLKQIIKVHSVMMRTKGGVEKMVDSRAVAMAISELNKMDGDLAAIKKELSGPGGAPISHHALNAEEYKLARQEMLDTDDC